MSSSIPTLCLPPPAHSPPLCCCPSLSSSNSYILSPLSVLFSSLPPQSYRSRILGESFLLIFASSPTTSPGLMAASPPSPPTCQPPSNNDELSFLGFGGHFVLLDAILAPFFALRGLSGAVVDAVSLFPGLQTSTSQPTASSLLYLSLTPPLLSPPLPTCEGHSANTTHLHRRL